LILE
jgi:hypothetical protein